MIRVGTIRFRLTAWYVLIMTFIVTAVAVVSWLAARDSLAITVDRSLSRDMELFQAGVRIHARLDRSGTVSAIRAATSVGLQDTLVRVFDPAGALIFQSTSLEGHLAVAPPVLEDGRLTFRTAYGVQGERVRLAAAPLDVEQGRYTVELVQPLTVGERSLERFGRLLALAIPVALIMASVSGYWLSGRALEPVERITADARRIQAQNLSARLAVPLADDELRQLSETLNDMLGRIQQSVSRMRQFTADASHELRAPLALIRTAADFSLLSDRPREELADAMRKILRESQHTTTLVDNLLWLARADATEDCDRWTSLDIAALCQDAADQAITLAAPKHITVSAEFATTSISVNGDVTGIRRLLLILVDNAVKYTAAGGQVRVQLRVEQNQVVMNIVDTGIGIDDDDIPYVFDRFWRADKVRLRSTGGTGLGLAIAQSIVERHGGTIGVSSELGKGSTFTVRLPVAQA